MWLTGWVAMGAVASPPGADAVAEALSHRHAAPCGEIEALSPDPVGALTWVTEHVQQPPWAGVRAASCLVDHHAEAVEAQLRTWITDPAARGFGRVVIASLDRVPADLARSLAEQALQEGPEPTRTARTLRRLERPELRSLGSR